MSLKCYYCKRETDYFSSFNQVFILYNPHTEQFNCDSCIKTKHPQLARYLIYARRDDKKEPFYGLLGCGLNLPGAFVCSKTGF